MTATIRNLSGREGGGARGGIVINAGNNFFHFFPCYSSLFWKNQVLNKTSPLSESIHEFYTVVRNNIHRYKGNRLLKKHVKQTLKIASLFTDISIYFWVSVSRLHVLLWDVILLHLFNVSVSVFDWINNNERRVYLVINRRYMHGLQSHHVNTSQNTVALNFHFSISCNHTT